MSKQRKTDNEEYHRLFPVERYYNVNGKWFYYARALRSEMPFIHGPFDSKSEAIDDCKERFTNK